MRNRKPSWKPAAFLGSGALLLCTAAYGQEPAKGAMAPQTKATEGSTEVAAEGFQAAEVAPPDEEKHTTEFKVSAGGLFTSGNSKLVSMTGASRFRARREDNQLSMAAAANYGRSAVPDEDMRTSVKNFQGKVRYDRFLGAGFAAFLALSGRNDRFQGLDLRLNLDPGIAYYFIDQEKHQLWTEVGYDFQYDVRTPEAMRLAIAEDRELDKTEVRHSARFFLGYENNLSETVTFNTGVEYLQGLEESKYWRLNWDAGLTSSVSNALSIATTFGLRYDNAPLPGIATTDTVTAVSLVYTLL